MRNDDVIIIELRGLMSFVIDELYEHNIKPNLFTITRNAFACVQTLANCWITLFKERR